MRYTGYTETFDDAKGHQYHFKTILCPRCSGTEVISVFAQDLFRYNSGAKIQDCFPYVSPGRRERLMTGICPPCFAALFAEVE